MLEGIKSHYFIKKLFSHLYEKTKLDIVKYNKILQNRIKISLINYKFWSHRYIEFETKKEGKEYDYIDDKLIFEGEYLNGKRNGKGREYWSNYSNKRKKFEGEYLNGKKTGTGKEFYGSGELSFIGVYLNGKKNGKGSEYYDELHKIYNKSYLKFEGEYLNDKFWNGKFYDNDGNFISEIKEGKGYIKEYDDYLNLLFEGEYLNGKRNGKGKEYYEFRDNNIKFEGEYFYDKKWNGKGYDNKNNFIYEIKDGKGLFKKYNNTGEKLFGDYEYIHGEKNGKAKEYYFYDNSKLIFEGEYLNGFKIKGKEYYDRNGHIKFEGEYLYGYRLKGKEYYLNDKLKFEGEYLYNKYYNGKGYDKNGKIIFELKKGNGNVKEYGSDDELRFEGEFKNGRRNGKGKEYAFGKLSFQGEYLNGKRHGKGKEYDFGKLRFQGEYLNGERK